jgi:chemotaxis protein histidine kinase CheA
MNEPVLDLSEIVGLYKEDARRSVQLMRAALARWEEVASGGPACKELRKHAHQLRGSGRTYGFCRVTRIGKAMEHLIVKLEAHRISADARLRKMISDHIEQLAGIFQS